MKQKLLTIKSLLVAVLLGVGVNGAWAGTNTLFSQNYQSATDVDWSCPNNAGGLSLVTSGLNKYLQYYGNQENSRGLYLYANEGDAYNVASLDNYTIKCDFYIDAFPTNGSNTFQFVFLGNGSSYSSSNVNYGVNTANPVYLYIQENAVNSGACTVYVNDATSAAGSLTFETGKWYTITQVITKNALDNTKRDIVTTITDDGGNSIIKTTDGSSDLDNIETAAVSVATLSYFKGFYIRAGRYQAKYGVDNISITTQVDAEAVSKPSIAVAYNGANRTVTITSGVSTESNAVTTYYTLNGDDPTSSDNVYSTPLDIDEACTVKAISISSTDIASEIASQAVTVGKLKLVAPTFAKTGYSNGKYTVSMTSDQSGLAFPPASTTHYYAIDGGDAVAYSAPFEINAGSSVTGYVAATDYTNSDDSNLTSAVRPVLSEVWSIDFAAQATVDKGGVTVGDEAFTANGTSFGNITSDGLTSNDNFGVKTGSTWLLRNNSRGLYSQNGSGTPVGVKGLSAGQYIRMVVSGMDTRSASGAGSLNDDLSTTTELYIVANEDGNVNINFNRYVYIKSIAVCNVVTSVSKTITAAGWATYCSPYALDFTSAIANLDAAYIVTGGADGVLAKTPVTSTVPANTGLLLKGEGACTIPVVASSTTNVSTNKLVGVTANTVIDANDGYVLMGTPTLGFYQNNNAFTVGANTAYLPADFAGAGAPSFFSFDSETTGIDASLVNNEQRTVNSVYNLAGQRVAQPTKGLYIVNGKKAIIK